MPASPDLPAYICYAIVLIVGAFVAWSSVRALLSDVNDRLAFGATWQLLAVYTLLPVALFWFLDYTSAIRDTALFAALLVGFAYQQIFSGGVQSIQLPGPTQALWAPFQSWAKAVADRVLTKLKLYHDRFISQRTQFNIAARPKKRDALAGLVAERNDVPQALLDQINNLPANNQLERVRLRIRALRASDPENYGYALYRSGIVSGPRYWWFLRQGRAWLVSSAIALALLVPIGVLWGFLFLPSFVPSEVLGNNPSAPNASMTSRSAIAKIWAWTPGPTKNWEKVQLWYFRWRLRKPNTSPADRDRTEDFVVKLVKDAKAAEKQQNSTNPANKSGSLVAGGKLTKVSSINPAAASSPSDLPDYLKPLNYVLGGALHDFCSETESADQADRVLRLAYRVHSALVDRVIVTRLVDCLETPSPDIRSRIQQALVLMVEDYPDVKPPPPQDVMNWKPLKDDPASQIDGCTHAWEAWWSHQFGGNSKPVGVCRAAAPIATATDGNLTKGAEP
jgi:hypothetical protein